MACRAEPPRTQRARQVQIGAMGLPPKPPRTQRAKAGAAGGSAARDGGGAAFVGTWPTPITDTRPEARGAVCSVASCAGDRAAGTGAWCAGRPGPSRAIDVSDTMFCELKLTEDAPAARRRPFPAVHPFAFASEPATGLVRQRVSPALTDLLRRIYEADSNIGYLRDDHVLAPAYGGDFLRFLLDACRHIGDVREALEIGCGGGHLMRHLGDHGLRVRGVDPSPLATAAAARHGLDVRQGFFPGPAPEARCDLVYHMDVLEHVLDLAAFLAAHHQALTDEGHVAISVPDCGPSIAVGDLGMVIHQHVNFFTATSLEAVLTTHGFDVVTIERARVAGHSRAARRRPASSRRPGRATTTPGAPMTDTAPCVRAVLAPCGRGQRRVESASSIQLVRASGASVHWHALHAEADWATCASSTTIRTCAAGA